MLIGEKIIENNMSAICGKMLQYSLLIQQILVLKRKYNNKKHTNQIKSRPYCESAPVPLFLRLDNNKKPAPGQEIRPPVLFVVYVYLTINIIIFTTRPKAAKPKAQ